MAFTTTPYCALADVRLFLDAKTTTSDTFIQALIPQAQAEIDQALGYSFQADGTHAAPATRVYSGTNTGSMLIERCMELVQVQETSYAVAYGAFGAVQNFPQAPVDITADCYLGPDPNVLPGYMLQRYSGGDFYAGNHNYTVKGVFGAGDPPADIQRACILLTIHYFKMRDVGYEQVVGGSSDSGPGTYPMRYQRGWPQDVTNIIDRYRRTSFFTTGR